MDKKYNFLVVDDESDIVSILSDFLQDTFDCDVDVANNGFFGLTASKSRKYDVIVSDHRMPEMTGAEFINRVREEGGPNRLTPVVFLSGYVEEAKLGVKHHDGVVFLDKVLYPTELIPSIEQILDE
ncbi:MAG: response regulator [Oligoflexia bacterium]|nr:response regulator [Oligoflexia bacterium]